jgi:hypothetical protein
MDVGYTTFCNNLRIASILEGIRAMIFSNHHRGSSAAPKYVKSRKEMRARAMAALKLSIWHFKQRQGMMSIARDSL